MYLFLVGPPGVGKSTLAPVLARMLAASVVEIDRVVERVAGKSNRDTIERDGMERFRDLETRALRSLRPTPAWCVVDTGGGTPLRASNRTYMRRLGLVIGLNASLARIEAGIAATMGKRPDQTLAPRDRALHALRDPGRRAAYADVDVAFAVDGASTVEVARAIASWISRTRGLRVDVGGPPPYPIVIRSGLVDVLGEYVGTLGLGRRVALVTEPRAAHALAERARRGLERARLSVAVVRAPSGEGAKTVRSVARLWSAFATAGIGRDDGVVALGGGALGDAAGFAAATYMRGVPVVQVPTTLLGMVDASIGGKTAIDIPAGKNLVGAFHHPRAVLIDPTALATLATRQRSSGLAEVVKSAFLVDRDSVGHVERAIPRVLGGEEAPTLTTVTLAVEVKASVVTADPTEQGLRTLLNFGHTLGHAYEAATAYRATHGEAVAIGMVYACALAERLGLAPAALRAELEGLLRLARLPGRAQIPAAAWSLLTRDKKARAGAVRWVLPRRVGRFSLVADVSERDLRAAARVLEEA